MNKPLRKYELTEKKIDIRVKDRGDLKTSVPKCNNRLKKDEKDTDIAFPDGDSRKVSAEERQERTKLNIVMKLPTKEDDKTTIEAEDVKPFEKVGLDRKVIAKEAEKKAVMELKRIRDKYAVKPKISSIPMSQVKKEDVGKLASVKSDMKNAATEPIAKPQETTQATEISPPAKQVSVDKEKKELPNVKKKPLIRTVVGKNGSLPIYKAVTFVEQKRKRTKLDISIPNPATYHSKQNPTKCTDTSSIGPVSIAVSVREKPSLARRKSARKRDFKKSRRIESPRAIRDIRDNRSPSTEVAKWAPSSVNQQTQPYYEAWVNTRLAAISKYRKNDKKYLNDEAFLKSFKKALERPTTPVLYYLNFADERYTGRIKIKQK